ncbi:MAG: hypothetical protein HOH95_01380 [Dehalococcoidia bacterium]|jgi:hypothetical protein|nr:hypothetical protein [Dehalococcoidia bacterium]
MKVIGKDIGTVLEPLFEEVRRRLEIEAERELRIEGGAEGTFSNVLWQADAAIIQLHNGVPTHALPHVVGIALEHVLQRLERYPTVQRGDGADVPDGPMLRGALRELVLAPAADHSLQALNLDVEWEAEQRHQALKNLLRDAGPEWNDPEQSAFAFAALLYARAAIEHPLWESLAPVFQETLPEASQLGAEVESAVRENGWTSPGACLQSLLAARELTGLNEIAGILDRRTAATL